MVELQLVKAVSTWINFTVTGLHQLQGLFRVLFVK
jgi:hypothetical protein